jgi:hypothetical protein
MQRQFFDPPDFETRAVSRWSRKDGGIRRTRRKAETQVRKSPLVITRTQQTSHHAKRIPPA